MKTVYCVTLAVGLLGSRAMATASETPWIRTAGNGPWSAAATWEGGQVPTAGARVHVQSGHVVVYDARSETPIRALYVAGTLSFAADRDTRLAVGVRPEESPEGDGGTHAASSLAGRRVGDRIIITATHLGRDIGGGTVGLETEERTVTAIDGAVLTVDSPLAREHLG